MATARNGCTTTALRIPANFMAAAGTAGFSDEDRAKSFRGELRYTEVRPAAYNAKARLQDMDQDGIDLAVLYPTMLLGLQSVRDVDFAEAQARAYNDWCSDHTQEGEGRLFGAGAVPPMHEPDDVARVAARSAASPELPGMVSVFMRPNPAIDWRPFNDPVYDPIWQAAADTGLPIAFHPFLSPDLPGACDGLRLGRPRGSDGRYADNWNPDSLMTLEDANVSADLNQRPSVLFTQAIANPVDVMSSIAYLLAGGVCERFPDAKFMFLEANGGWLVPWLERLDHHCKKFQWEVVDSACSRRSTSGASAGSASTPTRRCSAFTANVAAVRRRAHHLGVGLPAPRRQVPRRHRGARRGARGPDVRAAAGDHQRERDRALRHRLIPSGVARGAFTAPRRHMLDRSQRAAASCPVIVATGLSQPMSGIPIDSASRTITRQNWNPPSSS